MPYTPQPQLTEEQQTLAQWALTLEVYAHALDVLKQHLPKTAKLVEKSTRELSVQFLELANGARDQSVQMRDIIALSQYLSLGNRQVSLEEFSNLFSQTLGDMVEKVLNVSKRSIAMLYLLEDALGRLAHTQNVFQSIDQIHKQASRLAAQIANEGPHAQAREFVAMAQDARQVARQIASLSTSIQKNILPISESVREGYAALKEIAAIDISANLLAKNGIDELLKSLLARNHQFAQILRHSARTTQQLSDNISSMVMGIQFQDRTSQYVENSVRVLGHLINGIKEMGDKDVPQLPDDDAQNMRRALAEQVISQFTLSEFAHLFKQNLQGGQISTADNAHGDNIELF